MKLVSKKIEEIKVYENNPIVHTEEQITKLASLIKEYGFKQPIVIDRNNVIVAGHGRLEACKELKFEEILCVIADDLTEDQIKAYRIADNKISELRYWDNDLLEFELDSIKENFKLESLGFSTDEIELLENTGIEDYFEEGFTSFADEMNNKSEYFQISFFFPKNKEDLLKNKLSELGKEKVTEEIIKMLEVE